MLGVEFEPSFIPALPEEILILVPLEVSTVLSFQVFEEYKVELENRWRSLLDDAVQDAVFLNARNNELSEEVAKLNLGENYL